MTKTKQIFVFLGLFLLIIGFYYLLGSFAAWTFNPAKWDSSARVLVAIIGGPIALMIAAVGTIELAEDF